MSRRLIVYAGVALIVAGCKTAPVFTPPAGSYTGLPATIEGVTGQRTIASVDSTFFGSNRPLLGRLFLSREYSGDGPVAVLSHAFWVERFGGNPAVVGTDIEVDRVARELVGIMPEGIDVPRGVALWIPRGGDSLDQEAQGVPDDPARGLREAHRRGARQVARDARRPARPGHPARRDRRAAGRHVRIRKEGRR